MLVQRQRVRQVEKKQDRGHMTKEFLCGVGIIIQEQDT